MPSYSKIKDIHSPYDDGRLKEDRTHTFDYINHECDSLLKMFDIMATNFVLNNPLELEEPLYMVRRHTYTLRNYQPLRKEYLILDLDKITSKEAYTEVIRYFDVNDYAIVLGESRSYNGKDNFNLKGILKVDITNNKDYIEKLVKVLQLDIGDNAIVDSSIIGVPSYQAPMRKHKVVHYNNGKNSFDDVYLDSIKGIVLTSNTKPTEDIINTEALLSTDLVEICLLTFSIMGYTRGEQREECVSFGHYSEVNTPDGYFWFQDNPFLMCHFNPEKNVNIYDKIKHEKVVKEYIKDKNKEKQKILLTNKKKEYKKTLIVDERYLSTSDDVKKMIKLFIKNDSILKLKSAMGTGKSNIIESIIEESKDNKLRILIISSRISVAQDFSKKFDMFLYNNPDHNYIKGDNIVVQFDSLWQYDLRFFDLVILDEYVSLMFHHRSTLSSCQNMNISKFKKILDTKKIVVSDAFLSGYEDVFFPKKDIYYIENKYKDDNKLYSYDCKNFFIESIVNSLETKHKDESIALSTTSVAMIPGVTRLLTSMGFKVTVLNSDTPYITKQHIYKLFEEKHAPWDIIIYSPTLTVGVSILNNVKAHFHYDSSASADVVSSLQMTKRTRHCGELHYYIKPKTVMLETSIEELNKISIDNINTHYKGTDSNFMISIDTFGNFYLSETGVYINEIEVYRNIIETNHKDAFDILLENQFKTTNIKKIEVNSTKYSLDVITRSENEIIKKDKLSLISSYSGEEWCDYDIDDIKSKSTKLTDRERALLYMDNIKSEIITIDEKIIKELYILQIESNGNFLDIVKKVHFVSRYTKAKVQEKLSNLVVSNMDLEKREVDLKFYTYLKDNDVKLKQWFSEKEINYEFRAFIKKIGYKKRNSRFELDKNIEKYMPYIIK
jgi:hypothetical protein